MEVLIAEHLDKLGISLVLVWLYFLHRDVKSNSDEMNNIKENHLHPLEKEVAVLAEKCRLLFGQKR